MWGKSGPLPRLQAQRRSARKLWVAKAARRGGSLSLVRGTTGNRM
jgi:hypothetical protein